MGAARISTAPRATRLVLAAPRPRGRVYAFDASVVLEATAAPARSTLVTVLENYASQLTAAEVATIDASAPAQQRTWLLDLDQATVDDPLYAGLRP